ncbi:hypothetical protein A2U01_0062526, partial [Trifolium medium]|nr:hypothetical protein [Trifolium medium]
MFVVEDEEKEGRCKNPVQKSPVVNPMALICAAETAAEVTAAEDPNRG